MGSKVVVQKSPSEHGETAMGMHKSMDHQHSTAMTDPCSNPMQHAACIELDAARQRDMSLGVQVNEETEVPQPLVHQRPTVKSYDASTHLRHVAHAELED